MVREDITEEMLAACHAACVPTNKAFRNIVRKNVEAQMRSEFKIELSDSHELLESIVDEVMRRLGH